MISKKEKYCLLLVIILLFGISFNVAYAHDDCNDTYLNEEVNQQNQLANEIDDLTIETKNFDGSLNVIDDEIQSIDSSDQKKY